MFPLHPPICAVLQAREDCPLPWLGLFSGDFMFDPKNHWHQDITSDMDITGFGMVNGRLQVTFNSNGGERRYQYTSPDMTICCRWELAQSIGRFFHTYVKPLPYARLY
jgi:hypothetical protein